MEREHTDAGSRYRPVKDAAQFAAEQMRTAMGPAAAHSAVLQHFVTALSAADEAALRALLAGHADQ